MICNIYGSSLTNKFNKERHIRDVNNKFKVNPACQKNLKDDPTLHHENEEQLKNEQNKSEQLFWLIQSNKYRNFSKI